MGWGINQYDLVKIHVRRPCTGYYVRWYYNGWHYFFFYPGKYTQVTEGENYRTIGTRQLAMGSGQQTNQLIAGIRTIMNTREVYLLTIAGWMNIRIIPGSVNIYTNQIAGNELEFIAVIGSKEISYATGYSPVPGDGSVPEIPIVDPSIDYCEVIIGDQVWMCKNFDSSYPGSKVYNNDEDNRAVYGGLYTFDQIKSPGFCPDGWHVPSLAEWETLIAFIGGYAVGGGELKEAGFSHWLAPNTGAADTYDFAALGGGYLSVLTGTFVDIFNLGFFWTADIFTGSFAYAMRMRYDSAAIALNARSNNDYLSVRLIRDTLVTCNDWFLPTIAALNLIRNDIYLHGLGGFTADDYWSSDEHIPTPTTKAGVINFLAGATGPSLKGTINKVRPIRKFTAAIGAYSVRDTGPCGGLVFWTGAGTYYEVGLVDLADSAWSNIINVAVGTTPNLGDGLQNTLDIIAQPGHTNSAAKLCRDLYL